MADPKAKDAPKRQNLEARFDPSPAEVQAADVRAPSTLYSDKGDKPPPVAENKGGAKAAPKKSVSDLAYGTAEPQGAVAARTALTRDHASAEALAQILEDHPQDKEAILREAEQHRGAGFSADVERFAQKAGERPQQAQALAEAATAAQAPEAKQHDERGAEIQRGEATQQGPQTTEAGAEGGVHQVQQVDTQQTE